jgi:hypothetical protein
MKRLARDSNSGPKEGPGTTSQDMPIKPIGKGLGPIRRPSATQRGQPSKNAPSDSDRKKSNQDL